MEFLFCFEIKCVSVVCIDQWTCGLKIMLMSQSWLMTARPYLEICLMDLILVKILFLLRIEMR